MLPAPASSSTLGKSVVIVILWACLIGVGYLSATSFTGTTTSKVINSESEPAGTIGSSSRSGKGYNNNFGDDDDGDNGKNPINNPIDFDGESEERREGNFGNGRRWISGSPVYEAIKLSSSSSSLPVVASAAASASLLQEEQPEHDDRPIYEPILHVTKEEFDSDKYQIINELENGAKAEAEVEPTTIIKQHSAAARVVGILGIVDEENGNHFNEESSELNEAHFLNSIHDSTATDNGNGNATQSTGRELDEKGWLLVSTKLESHFLRRLLHQLNERERKSQAHFLHEMSRRGETLFESWMEKFQNVIGTNTDTGSGSGGEVKQKPELNVNKRLDEMNENLKAGLAKMEASYARSQLMLDLTKESFHQMDRIQDTVDDALTQIKALKTELGHVGKVALGAIYNIQKSEENLMKKLGASWNKTVYAMRQEAPAAGTATATAEPTFLQKTENRVSEQDESSLNQEQLTPFSNNRQDQDIIQRDDDSNQQPHEIPNAQSAKDSYSTGRRQQQKKYLDKSQMPVPCLSGGTAATAARQLINPQFPKDCSEIQGGGAGTGYKRNGLYKIFPYKNSSSRFAQVYCDLENSDGGGGGWTVVQRRGNYETHRESFQRSWGDYEQGFGSAYHNFWIGLAPLASLTSQGDQMLRIELTDWSGEKRVANYAYFRVGNSSELYKIHVADFQGNAGDSLSYHNGMSFTTFDSDNDLDKELNCAQKYFGGWWYRNCHQANLNGLYTEIEAGQTNSYGIGVNWYTWHGYYYSLKHVEMKIRPRDFFHKQN